jgi:hypothetical protein
MVIKGFLDMYLIRLLFLFVFLNPSFLMAQEEPIIFYGDSEQVPQMKVPFCYLKIHHYSFIQEPIIDQYLAHRSCRQIFG